MPSRPKITWYIQTDLMLHPSPVEVSILLILAAVSGLLFLYRILPVFRIVRASPRDTGWEYGSSAKRVRDFVWEVLLQGKVIRQRPLPGIAHAFVFWGFCAFALVSLDHLARGGGVHLLNRDGWIGSFYFYFAGAFAVLVAVSIIGLAVRRFVVRPLWLGEVSLESGFIGLLILTLMLTYLATFAVAEDSTAGRLNWWAHTLALIIFLPLIPHTKHLHLVLSPVTIFLKRQHFSEIPKLEGEEDLGIESGKQISWLMALQTYSCVECGRCSEHCPATNTGKVLDPKKIALGVREYLKTNGANAELPLVGEWISEQALFECTTCGACEYQCPVGIQHVPIIQGLRRGLVNTGKWEDEYGGKLFRALEKNGNALGMASMERDKFIKKAELPFFDGTQEYCLWLGCMGAYDPQGREIITALARVLRHLNITFGVLKKERCSGDPVRRLGNDYLFQQLGEFNLEQIDKAKAVKMLSICPHCVRTMREDWAEVGRTMEVEHHSELLARHLGELPSSSSDGAVVYHDPCYIGRYREIYDAPRSVAEKAGTLVEAERSHERAMCCGAGGGRAFLGEEEGARISVTRAGQLAATGAAVVGAACPFCNTMFRDALVQIGAGSGKPAPKLLDIAQIAAAQLPTAADPPPSDTSPAMG